PATARPRPTASSSASSRLSSTSISTESRSVTELPSPPLSTATRPSTTTSARTRRSPSALRSRPGGTSTVPPVRIFSPRKLSHFLDTGQIISCSYFSRSFPSQSSRYLRLQLL